MTRMLLALLVVLLSAPAQPAHGATVRLKNGNRLEGAVTVAEDGQVAVEISGLGTLTFSQDEVALIEESEEPVEPAMAARSESQAEEGAVALLSEMSYRVVTTTGDTKESGISIQQFPGRIVIRNYQIPVSEEVRAQHPILFNDRTARLTKEEHEEVWLQLLEAVDVWNLQSEPAPKDPAVIRCEATFKRGERVVHYVVYATEKPCWALTPYRGIDRVLNNSIQAFGMRDAEKRDGKPFGAYSFVKRKQPGSSR